MNIKLYAVILALAIVMASPLVADTNATTSCIIELPNGDLIRADAIRVIKVLRTSAGEFRVMVLHGDYYVIEILTSGQVEAEEWRDEIGAKWKKGEAAGCMCRNNPPGKGVDALPGVRPVALTQITPALGGPGR